MPARAKVYRPPSTRARTHQTAPAVYRQQARLLPTNSAEWRRIRAAQLEAEPLCRECAKRGYVRAANEVDHIEGDTTKNVVMVDLQSLCKPCHSRKTAAEDGSFGNARGSMYPRWMPKPLVPVTLVCGPSGGGKTTYVAKHAARSDLVLDLDEIAHRLTGRPLYERTDRELHAAIRWRNKALAQLAQEPREYARAWFIAAAPSESKRRFWRELLDADVVVINPGLDVCIARIRDDKRRSTSIKELHEHLARQWH
jgi:5-methylcytosine-specific restriction protein A